MNVQALCDRLLANDAALTYLCIDLKKVDDAELKLILDAAKKNKTLKKLRVVGSITLRRSLSVPAALSLASLVSEHPEIQEIEFYSISFIEFGPIALAIQQNRNLTCLLFWECRVTPNLVEYICWLLTENALESMTLKAIFKDAKTSFDISGALLGNSSLNKLVLHDPRGVFGSKTFQAIPHMIRTNQDFETIDLLFSKRTIARFEVARLVAQAAEGHASLNTLAIKYSRELLPVGNAHHVGTAAAICTMLHNAPALREFSLSDCYMGSAGARHLADVLSSKNSVVEKLDLSRNKLRDEDAGLFARLIANQNLKSLVLRENNIGDAGALEIAVALRQNNTLDLLDLKSNAIGSDGASALADALVLANDSLKVLDLGCNLICVDGATSIAEMLTRNESIEKFGMGGFDKKGLKAFATRLSSMNCLKILEGSTCCDAWGYTSEIGSSFVLALEQNTTLVTIDIGPMHRDVFVMPQVQRLLDLNRGGRRLLSATGESLPPLNYWPRILARSSDNADVLFHFLREIPNVLVVKASSRKRKHGDHDETNSTMYHT
jgi:hypothetical protein